MRQVTIVIILDFMCPWSYIGLRALHLAKQKFTDQIDFSLEFLPFEFDAPGTYPPNGTDWTAYCESFGAAKAKFLLEEKLPRAFAIGRDLGINFRMERRIVHTENVNNMLLLAQRSGVAEAFALQMMKKHFEELYNPNDEQLLRNSLLSLGVPTADVEASLSESKVSKAERNERVTNQARQRGAPPVPKFSVFCLGHDVCAAINDNGPTNVQYFTQIFESCL
ncbi:hypothetical protein CYMTET_23433 [Cymbomonas tetramitiformis]|uniref:DSBA-like thioredoxin domain-containing protein n=1 Tax=Cymbomonas tetramitiformis TaxID=36881 RepID=A0AAE0L195_9CHLO|nr:hypothetical protein CYMTET_23433 [Cymbomonas tetramitiformis]|eukprot:gene28258-35005_t